MRQHSWESQACMGNFYAVYDMFSLRNSDFDSDYNILALFPRDAVRAWIEMNSSTGLWNSRDSRVVSTFIGGRHRYSPLDIVYCVKSAQYECRPDSLPMDARGIAASQPLSSEL